MNADARPARGGADRLVWIAPLATVLIGALAWRGVLGWALLGWDSYPMIWAGRITDAASFFGTFTEELMDGRYPLGSFWRPVVHFAFALDHALWGLDPFGYHLSDLIVMLGSAALVALLAQRLSGGPAGGRRAEGLLAGLTAGLVFALHPLHFEVLPVAPRRADGLAVLFTLLALHAGLAALCRGGLAPRVAAGICCALALASKETGAIALVALGLLALCVPEPGPGRLARAARTVWPAALACGLTLALRSVALGGLGGGQESSLTGGFAHAPALALVFARALFLPPSLFALDPADPTPPALALLSAAALAAWFALRGGAGLRAAALFLAAWALLLLPLLGMSALAQGWYAFPYLPVLALGAGLAAAAGQRAFRERRRITALLGGLAAAALVAVAVLGSPCFDDTSDFERASTLEREFLAEFERRLAAAVPGQAITVQGCPTVMQRVTRRGSGETAYFIGPDQALDAAQFERGRLIYVLASYSLEAWADLTLGEGKARVTLPGLPPSARAPGPERIDVTVLPPPLGFTR